MMRLLQLGRWFLLAMLIAWALVLIGCLSLASTRYGRQKNCDCAPRQLGFKRSNFKHNPQTGPRGGVVLKTKYTEGGWPVFGKMRGGQQRFVEDWNADGSRWTETHDRVNQGATKYDLAEEKMPESTLRSDQRPEVPLNFRTPRNNPFDYNAPDLPTAPDPFSSDPEERKEYREYKKYEERILDGEFEDYEQDDFELVSSAPEPADGDGSRNGNGHKATYSELLGRTSSKSPTRKNSVFSSSTSRATRSTGLRRNSAFRVPRSDRGTSRSRKPLRSWEGSSTCQKMIYCGKLALGQTKKNDANADGCCIYLASRGAGVGASSLLVGG